MKYNKFVRFIMFISLLCFFLLAYGFAKGAYTVLNPQKGKLIASNNTQKKKDDDNVHKSDQLKIVALGDSLTRGVGDDEGTGYVGRLKNDLQKEYKQSTSISNLAVSGAKTSDLLHDLKKKNIQETLSTANIVVLSIGSNDLFPGANQMNEQFLKTYRPDEKTFQNNLNSIFKIIHQQNPNASIYAFGYYNPFHNVQGLDASSSFVYRWNNLLELATLQVKNAYVIPTFDLFYNEEDQYLYTDHFHPNKDGYIEMANRLTSKIGSQLRGESNE
ncbi:GDSL-type esterase/lipase family protein [Bacillus sp. AFS017336]|uniref:GDSL-type esterase/lipase family protein n=1 Tax=Bacillus sp. AFS017336 TaxID=2033489 RepID=UPI000BEFF01F|nr:GDSL-type esterase/lipase family protein [Bacillus sp. AFS017336]PEL12075.1 lipase [Bacillus sp. AFS017336]